MTEHNERCVAGDNCRSRHSYKETNSQWLLLHQVVQLIQQGRHLPVLQLAPVVLVFQQDLDFPFLLVILSVHVCQEVLWVPEEDINLKELSHVFWTTVMWYLDDMLIRFFPYSLLALMVDVQLVRDLQGAQLVLVVLYLQMHLVSHLHHPLHQHHQLRGVH